jgi:hypothetical protein
LVGRLKPTPQHDVLLSDELAELLTPPKEAPGGAADAPDGGAYAAGQRQALLLRIAKASRPRVHGFPSVS